MGQAARGLRDRVGGRLLGRQLGVAGGLRDSVGDWLWDRQLGVAGAEGQSGEAGCWAGGWEQPGG